MKKTIFLLVSLFIFSQAFSQETENDTIKKVALSEVIVIGKANLKNKNDVKLLSSIDQYLEKSNKVTMIKRGNYAWEATLNNMLSERISVTIDGMQVFGACTDKMDPITSYIDVSNVSEVGITSGQQGSEHGSTIGGGIDFKLQKSYFDKEELTAGIETGYETNGDAKTVSSEVNFSNKKFFINTDGIYRTSNNYKTGGDNEVLFSQFNKYNVSLVSGIKLGKNNALIGSLIYDRATDVGYPALPMDVSLAEAIITSLEFQRDSLNSTLSNWRTKVYFNSVTHVMDDTKRPNVPIHMDMPGWSDTFGFYSKLNYKKGKHSMLFNMSGFYNKSLAEMTMYPNDQNENIMFMLTWPDVRTTSIGLFAEDEINLKENQRLKVTARVGVHNNEIKDEFGLNSLKIFYPEMEESKTRMLLNLSSQYEIKHKKSAFLFSLGYGERAPSVTEGYGFYLFNSFDNYDYIGNPDLKNEKSYEFSAVYNYTASKFKAGLEASYFYLNDYIIGETAPDIGQMTIGANGVRIYTALDGASLFNSKLSVEYKISPSFTYDGHVSYHLGRDNDGTNLPLISPFTFKSALQFKKNLFDAEVNMTSAGQQVNYSSYFGENKTDSYAVFNLNASYIFYLNKNKLYAKAGVENIFDKEYSTYADWNNIPRMGRNFFINLSYTIK